MATKRIAAIVLPQLACELVRQRGPVSPSGKAPLAVILEAEEERRVTPVPHAGRSSSASTREPAPATSVIDVVDDEARRYGVRSGQRVVEAAALVAHLAIHRVTFAAIDAALGRVAEVALGLGATAAIQLGQHGALASSARAADPRSPSNARSPWGDGPFDTVWLDITGAAHLVGGEEALLDELGERVAALGHRARLAIADGPRLAQALARWGLHAAPGVVPSPAVSADADPRIAPPGGGAQAIGPLPVQALPVAPEVASFLVRLGVLRVDDLARLPRSAVAARLGSRVNDVMELLAGRDQVPLVPFEVPRLLEEEMLFEDGIESAESLLFVLRGMTSRVAARLTARGEACGRIDVEIAYDRSIARLRHGDPASREGDGAAAPAAEPDVLDEPSVALRFHIDLPVTLSDAGDLLRPLKAKLEQIELAAPAVGLRLEASRIARARRVQLDLSRDRSVDPDSLPALLAELSAEIGQDRVGVLEIADAHRPEARSRLAPATFGDDKRRTPLPADEGGHEAPEPARLLAQPIPLGRVGRGTIVAVDRHLYAVERLRFVMRLDAVEWWTPSPASRDYARAWLVSGSPSGKPGAPSPLSWAGGRPAPSREGASASTCSEAWIYVDRATGEAFLQGWCE